MAQEFLKGSNVVAILKKMGREGVPKRVAGGGLGDTCLMDGFLPGPLRDGFGKVVPVYGLPPAMAGTMETASPAFRGVAGPCRNRMSASFT